MFDTDTCTYTYADPPPPPREVKISTVNYSSREVTFSWSPVDPDCPAISYNILSSNCGSCPTTTNHTNVTCTDVFVPTGNMCTFAVQTVSDRCGKIVGNTTNPILVQFTSSTNPDTHTCVNQSSTISISSLAVALVVSLVVSITVITIIVMRGISEIKALKLQLITTAEKRKHVECTYEYVTSALPTTGAINMQDNAAYGHINKHEYIT